MKRAILITILFNLVLCFQLFAQNNCFIEGTVRDQSTGEALRDVEVYINNSAFGTTTNKDGHFKLKNIPSGIHMVIAASIGYSAVVRQVILSEMDAVHIKLYMMPKVYQIPEVYVESTIPKNWKKRFKKFEEEFLGHSGFSDQCVIENPEVLNFKIEPGTGALIANSDSTIIVLNQALGYRLYIRLAVFRWQDNAVEFQIYPLFKELKPSSPDQRDRWKVNRNEAYDRSFRHFLHALSHHTAWKEGFRYDRGLWKLKKEENYNQLVKRGVTNIPLTGYKFTSSLNVRFHYRKSRMVKSGKDYIFVDSYGNLLEPLSVALSGSWGRYRVASMLPFDYRPDK